MNRTERSEMDDDDKCMYTRIGKTEINVNKIFKNLLVKDEYVPFKNIIRREDDDEYIEEKSGLYSIQSNK